MKEEEARIVSLLEGPLKELGYDLSEVRLSGNKDQTLSILVDRLEPISLEDIVAVSERISAILDAEDPIAGAYVLDVSSLGAEKPIALENLGQYEGRYVNLHLSHPFKGENILEGHLRKVTEETVLLTIKVKSKALEVLLPREHVDKARLAIEL